MRLVDGRRLYSASDLVTFLECAHATFLDLINLETPLPNAGVDPEADLVREKGWEHERRYLQHLRDQGHAVVEIASEAPLDLRFEQTRAAMAYGAEVIYQAALLHDPWHGHADFLRRVDTPSRLGGHAYEPVDTKLARSPTAAHVLQLCAYADLLAAEQGCEPHALHLVLGDGREISVRYAEFTYYALAARERFETFVATRPQDSYPEPCQHCEVCCWRDLCAEQWQRDDHLSLVADIRRSQILKLEKAGIETVRALAEAPEDLRIPKLAPATFRRLRAQARLQVEKGDTGENRVEILPLVEGRGFARLPPPDPGDLFFDMEGDPHFPDGLEYLFGFYHQADGTPEFRPFWAHDHDAERAALEAALDFVLDHLARHPGAFVYHYNHYEVTALKRLASRYGTRESALDDLLRRQRFVDLYRVVRDAIRVSEPAYSLKNLEAFYMEKRAEAVATAGDSILVYERWRQTGEGALLEQIRAYNEVDCRSTLLLRDWLLGLRPADLAWWVPAAEESGREASERQVEAEARRAACERGLLERCPEDERPARELVAHLLEFHRREAKPQWWAMFDRQTRSEEELIEDAECLGGLRMDPDAPPRPEKRSYVFTYRFPPQEFKFVTGERVRRSDTLELAGEIVEIDPEGFLRLKRGMKSGLLPEVLSIIPRGPLDSDILRDAVYRYAEAVAAGRARYRAIRDLLARERPRIAGLPSGAPVVRDEADPLEQAIQAVVALDNSYLFIQGPPGAGKTFTSSHVIVALLRAGRKVGVASNSHKAINNLLRAVERRAEEQGLAFRGIKKSTANQPESFFNGRWIEDVVDNDDVDTAADLIAGTAWLFARPELDQALDYLFVDEAGQVSLANIVAMGLSARNIVLVGDQMQLGQPIQGAHPGESGQSVLEYLLRGNATIPPDRGIFLATTWRMHANLCRFISEAVYEGRLLPEPANQRQRLILSADAHPALVASGLRFLAVPHEGCGQKSEEEGELLAAIYRDLLRQHLQDRHGAVEPITTDNILVVSPYNVQVNYLRSILPAGARAGTVDKFQGQEAEVVLISMTTSSAEELPRDIEFLYSRNRLNVAISRARTLAILIASPRLLDIPCRTVEQVRLVNTLCWAREYARRFEPDA